MNKVLLVILLLVLGTLPFLGWKLIEGYDIVQKLPEASCDKLLKMIQREGMKPNYQYDVREWIAKECWK